MSPLKFIVLSDLHLGPPGVPVNGLDTGARLAEALDVITRDHADAAFVLLAGDLADRGEVAAYHHLRDRIAALPMPVHITLGNHDDRAAFLSVFGSDRDDPQGRVSQAIDAGGHRIVLLDTTEPGLVGGRLCQGRLDWLAARLNEARDRPVIVVQHHHANGIPQEMGSCHTGRIAGYMIEGHVPPADIRRLLEERPDAIGLAVPGMPYGSPGMGPETEREAYEVFLIRRDGSTEVFTSYAAA